jgi:chitin disaccharide deacetylase
VRADHPRARLLVIADDFGLHPDIDHGILECVQRRRVQGISFCPTGQSLEWKKLVELMDQGVHVGLHLTLVGEPWSTDGRFIPDWQHLVGQLLLGGQPIRAAIGAEIRRQLQLCADHGVDPRRLSHMDSHQHVHVLPTLWELCLCQAKEHGIPRIRVPWCPTLRIIKRSAGGIALQCLAWLRTQQVGGYLACLGLAHAGHNTPATLSDELHHAALAGRPDLELVAHPGRSTQDLQTRYSAWKFDWDSERDALLSAEFADAVERNGYDFGDSFH